MKHSPILLLFLFLCGCSESSAPPEHGALERQRAVIDGFETRRTPEKALVHLVDQIEKASGKNVCLNPPASAAEIKRAERVFGQQLTPTVKEIYAIANGQSDAADCVALFPNGFMFLPLDAAIREWRLMERLLQEEAAFGTDYGKQGAVRGTHWNSNWFPLAYSVSGDLLCIDFDPTASGTVGQVIEFVHDDIPRFRHGKSLHGYIERTAEELASGQLYYRADWDSIQPSESE